MHLFDTFLGKRKKLFDQPISDTLTSTMFFDVHREDVASVLRSLIRRDIKARNSGQGLAFKCAKDGVAEPMAISRRHGVTALILFRSSKRLGVVPNRFRANVAKRVEIIDGQSSNFD